MAEMTDTLATSLRTLSINDMTAYSLMPLDMNVTNMTPLRPKIGVYAAYATSELLSILAPHMQDEEQLDPETIELIPIENEKCYSFFFPENMISLLIEKSPTGTFTADDGTIFNYTLKKGAVSSGKFAEKSRFFGHLERPARVVPVEIPEIQEAIFRAIHPLGLKLHESRPIIAMRAKTELKTLTGRYHINFDAYPETAGPGVDPTMLKAMTRITVKGIPWKFIPNITFRRAYNLCDKCLNFMGRGPPPAMPPGTLVTCPPCSIEKEQGGSSSAPPPKGKSKEERKRDQQNFLKRFQDKKRKM